MYSTKSIGKEVWNMKKENKTKRTLKIRVYYFSATGNTKYGLLMLQKHLSSEGHTCELLSIENQRAIENGDWDLLGFASPVYGGYPTENMINFIRQSADFDDVVPAFTVVCACSSVGYWGSRELYAEILKEKNIRVISELGFLGNPSHPSVVGSLEDASPKIKSFFDGIDRPDSLDEKYIREFSEKLVSTYEDYSSGRSIAKLKHSSLKIQASMRIRLKEINFQKLHPIMLDQDKCTKCGFCQRACPVKAITLNPYPERDMSKCFNCQKCTNLCPQHAFYLKDIEKTGHYKGAFDKIRKMNEADAVNDKANETRHKKPLLLKFFSTGVGMGALNLIGKYTDRKLIKEGGPNSEGAQV